MLNQKKSSSKKKGGWVYGLESTRKDGTKKIYAGKTSRSLTKRWEEHFKEVKKKNSKTWIGKGKHAKPLGAIWSKNPSKAEKTIKKMSPKKKRTLFTSGARKYKKRKI